MIQQMCVRGMRKNMKCAWKRFINTKKKLVLEEERAFFANVLKNIKSSPDLTEDYEELKSMRAKLACQECVNIIKNLLSL